MSVLRVLFVANDPLGSTVTRYRCENLAAALPPDRFQAEVVYVGASRVRVDHDIVVLHRICMNAQGRRYLRAARACGAVVVYGADDLVFAAEAFPENVEGVHQLFRRFAPLHQEMLQAADAVLVSTEYLADWVRRPEVSAGAKPVFVQRNFLSPAFLRLASEATTPVPKGSPDKVTVAYVSGSATHDGDLASIAHPLAEVLRSRPHAELLLVGPVEPPEVLRAPGLQVRRQGFVPWTAVPGILARADICLAPLELEPPFNHAKSEIKLLEAAAIGVPTIASSSAGFTEALRAFPGGGCLASRTDEWHDHLAALIDDPACRARVRDGAHELLAAQGTEEAQRANVAQVMSQIAGLPRPQPAVRRASRVHWPVSPPKYLVKKAVARWKAMNRPR
jgi:glycosyltransferase involved in cell wall biosynthesis